MTTVLGCIADDFTGATDLAGLLARSGRDVSLRIGIPDARPASNDTATFEVIALKCRTAPVAEAVNDAVRALDWLKATGAEKFFWKYCSTFDSTADGNIGPVAEALMDATGAAQTVYCPAFPENGRSVFMGNLFVGQMPLAESPMKDHPLTPMKDSNLMRLLAPQVTRPVGLVDRLMVARGSKAVADELRRLEKNDGIAHVVVDAVADSDLAVIAEACNNMAMPLMTGGSALAMPLPGLYAKRGIISGNAKPRSAAISEIGHGGIILSGSCSAMTRKQVERHNAKSPGYRLDPLVLAQEGFAAAIDWLDAQSADNTPCIYATAEPDAVAGAQRELGTARAGEIVENALAEIALAAHRKGIRRFVVAGGETSGAVTRALNVNRLDIGEEIAPGVPWTFSESGGGRIALALKSGNFGGENFFADAFAKLGEAA